MNRALLSTIFLLISLLWHSDLFSLETRVGAKGGVGLSYSLSEFAYYDSFSVLQKVSEPTEVIFTANGGLFVELYFEISSGFGFAVELDFLYQKRGGDFLNVRERITYLGMPVLVKGYLADTMFFGIGFNTQVMLDSSIIDFTSPGYRSKVDSSNVEFVVAIGAALPALEFLNLTVEARYYYGITNYSTRTNDNLNTRAVEFMAGIMLKV
ncbi:MAG: PorT family protein [Spirochaetota bacterium]|nr:PorT family protein [Spirochaetota bacterium]